MKKRYLVPMSLGVLVSLVYSNPVHAHGVANSKAAELSLHRLERLVILKKIEESYQNKIKGIKLELIPHREETEPGFKSTILQYPGTDGTQMSLEVILDGAGKAIKHTAVKGTEAQDVVTWPDKDAATLCENALHYVQDNAATKPELVPYNQNLTELSLSPGTNSSGASVAVVDIQAGAQAAILRVRMKLDGTFDSAEFIARTP